MAETCRSSLQVCRLRAARLDAGGYVMPGANNLIVTDAIIQLGMELEVEEGDEFVLKNGCGDLCATFSGVDRIKAVDLTMDLCELDHELIELLTGADLFASGGENRGFQLPRVDDPAPDGVAFEVWTKRWDGSFQDQTRGYFQWGFPRVRWRLGAITMENDFMRVPIVGVGEENELFQNGPNNDWPGDLNALFGVFETNTIPAATCGYQSTPAQTGS